jgi:mutator family transposase
VKTVPTLRVASIPDAPDQLAELGVADLPAEVQLALTDITSVAREGLLAMSVAAGMAVIGLWEGSTENKTVATHLLADLVSRGLDAEDGLLVVIDGAKALSAAVTAVFGAKAAIQRCTVHKRRNVAEHLPERRDSLREGRQLLHRGGRSAGPGSGRRHLVAGCGCRAPEPGLRPVDLHRLPVLRPGLR